MKKILTIFFLAVVFLSAKTVFAADTIDSFDASISINQDSSLAITETINYDFGQVAGHGIYRDIPYKYQARGGNYNLRLSVLSVEDESGIAYNYELSNQGRNKRIKIGDADQLLSGKKVFVIKYLVKRAINYFSDYDELYWNATGNEWQVPITKSSATIILPTDLDQQKLKIACYAGATGSTAGCAANDFSKNSSGKIDKIIFNQDNLGPSEGLTVVVGFPKGLVKQPDTLSYVLEFAKDNWIIALPILVFVVLFIIWRKLGRDPKGRGVIIAQFDSPDNLTPAEVGVIVDDQAQNKDVSGAIISLAVRGYLKITRLEENGLFKSVDYQLDKMKEAGEGLMNYENKLMGAIFSDKQSTKLSDLKEKFYKDLAEIKNKLYTDLVNKGYFKSNPQKIRNYYFVLGAIVAFSSFFLADIFGLTGIICGVLSGLLIALFGNIMPAKTVKGALAKEYILGLKTYLTVAEKDRLDFHNAPEKNPALFDKLLPYAMVLGVESVWAKQFVEIYQQEPSWYHDSGNTNFSTLLLADNLRGFQNQANTVLASSPNQASTGSSGFSGSSGGGFGGGGGGRW